MMEKELELLNAFPQISKEEWTKKVLEDLKGADFKKLIWRTYDGIDVQPFYVEEDIKKNSLPAHEIASKATREWVNYTEIRVENLKQANDEARKMLKFDVSGILFHLINPENVDFNILLQDIPPNKLHISFKTERPEAEVLRSYLNYCEGQNISLKSIRGFYESDILENRITKGTTPDFEAYKKLVWESVRAPEFCGISVKSHGFADSGSSISQEMAYTLNKVVEYVSQLAGDALSEQAVFDEIMLHMAVGGDYFFEITKLRALRILYQSIVSCYEVERDKVHILSSSNLWSKSLFDPHVNMLRNTTEAMSAILGGCDAVLIQPHDSSYRKPTDFSRRIAINISNILREESYFNKVTDPAGGSYYLEQLTSDLVEKGLEIFRDIEKRGGFISAFEAGAITKSIKNVRDQKLKDIASRKLISVGTNKYPNLQETAEFTETDSPEDEMLLKPQRSTKAFNLLRLKTQKHFEETGFIPKVYLACFGNLAMRKARATFAAEFFGTAGFRLLGEFPFSDVIQAAQEAAASEADIVVMCSSDADYETSATDFAENFKAAAPDKQLVLAGYPTDLVETLRAKGVDSFIHIKTNAADTLDEFQNRLFATA